MTAPIRPLTEMQQKVASLVGSGLTYKEIGKELGMSYHTARVHVNAIAALLPSDGRSAYRRVMVWVLSVGSRAKAA